MNIKNSVVSFNIPVKIRFEDGHEITVSIFEKEKSENSSVFQINKDAPLAKAILGHTAGEKIEYQVGNISYTVTILGIFNK